MFGEVCVSVREGRVYDLCVFLLCILNTQRFPRKKGLLDLCVCLGVFCFVFFNPFYKTEVSVLPWEDVPQHQCP